MYGRTDNMYGRRDTDAVRGGRAVWPECPSSISPCCPAHLDRFERCVCVAVLLGNTSRGERIFRPRCAARACDVHLWRGASRAFRMAKVVFTLRGGVQHGLAVGCGKRAGTGHKGGRGCRGSDGGSAPHAAGISLTLADAPWGMAMLMLEATCARPRARILRTTGTDPVICRCAAEQQSRSVRM